MSKRVRIFPYHNNRAFSLNGMEFKPLYVNAFKDEFDHTITLDYSILLPDDNGKISEDSKILWLTQTSPITLN